MRGYRSVVGGGGRKRWDVASSKVNLEENKESPPKKRVALSVGELALECSDRIRGE